MPRFGAGNHESMSRRRGGPRGAGSEAQRGGVAARAQSGWGRGWGGREFGCGRTQRRCAGVIDAAGLAHGEMGEDCLDDRAALQGRLDARDDAQCAATHATVFDVDVEDSLVPHEFDGVEHDMSGPVTEGVLESIHDLPAVIAREAFVRDRWAGDGAAQAFEGVPLMGLAERVPTPDCTIRGGDGGRIPRAERCRGWAPAGWARRCEASGPCARRGGRWRCGSGRRHRGVARDRRRVRGRGRRPRRRESTVPAFQVLNGALPAGAVSRAGSS